MWSDQLKEGPSQTSKTVDGSKTVQNLSKVWDTFSQTKAALRHIENKLEAAPTSTVVCDSVMSSKKQSSSATRKISRKDGRYLEDSLGPAPASKLSSRGKTRKEKSSRSPLRVTTSESNVKKSSRVEFRDPLVSYRETYTASPYMSSSHLEAKSLLAGMESAKGDVAVRTVYSQDTQEFDSTRSSAIDDTVVRYLNDRPAIDALQCSEHVLKGISPAITEELTATVLSRVPSTDQTDRCADTLESGQRNVQMAEMSQSSVSSTSSHRLEILRRRQTDAKLEKLKERIRKQWEHTEGAGGREMHLVHTEQPILVNNTERAVTNAKVRKVAMAPPAPAYKGFNPTETKIRTPDGKVWPEAEFHNISRELYRDLALKDYATTKEKANEINREKKVTKPARKIQKVARGLSPEVKSGRGNVISTSSWRDGQKLVKKILGPPPKVERAGRTASSDRSSRERTSRSVGPTGRAEPDVPGRGRPRSVERLLANMLPDRSLIKPELTAETPEKDSEEQVNKDFLPMEIRGILDDLQLDTGHREVRQEGSTPNHKSGRSKSPTKRKPDRPTADEPQITSKKRHYDSEEMQQYILRQQEERKKKQNEERIAQKEAKEQKTKRLQELYKKQKEAFSKSKSMSVPEPSAANRLQETYTKLIQEQTWLKEPTSQGVQPRPVYQPSGESDKENKGQERPLSASSSSDLSLSEPPQPLGRSNLVGPTWMQPDRLSPRSSQPPPQSSKGPLYPPQSEMSRLQPTYATATSEGGGLFSHVLTLEQMGLLQKDGESILSTNRQIASSARGSLSLPLQAHAASAETLPDPLAKPSTSQYQRKLDRIEALKATAASLVNRVDSEARQLACGSINYSTVWNTRLDVVQPSHDDDHWAKPVSPPVRERCEDAFSARIQKMLDTCVSHATFDDDLPGVGNLHEFRKLPQTLRPHSAVASLGIRSLSEHQDVEILHQQNQKQQDLLTKELAHSSQELQVSTPHESSAGSISEGTLLSEGSLSESDGIPLDRSPSNMVEALKGKEFCITVEDQLFGPLKEFQKEVESYQPFPPQIWSSTQGQGSWEELAKGSPHSVINIYAKSFLYGKGLEAHNEASSPVLQPMLPSTSLQNSKSYDDDFVSSQGSGSLTDRQFAAGPSGESSNSSILEERPIRTSPSQNSSNAQSGRSARSSASSKKRVRAERVGSRSATPHHPADHDRTTPRGEGMSQKGKKFLKSRAGSPPRDNELTQETDSTLEDLSVRSFASLSSDTGRSERTPKAPLSPGSQNSLHLEFPEKPISQSSNHGAIHSEAAGLPEVNITSALPHMNVLPNSSEAAAVAGPMHFSPAALQHRMAAELHFLSTIEESVRQLSDVERVRGISLAQQETVSLAQILKAQQQRHERDMALLKIKAEQEAHETQRQLDESRQKTAQAHADTVQQLVQSRLETAEQLQITTSKIAEQQVEAARLNIDVARQIREVTELARNRMSESIGAPVAPITTLFDRERQQHSEFMKQLRARVDTHRTEVKSQAQSGDTGVCTPATEDNSDLHQHYSPSYDTYSESSRSKNHDQSTSSSRQESPSVPSSKEKDLNVSGREKLDSSIEEAAHTAEDDSLHSASVPSLPEERDTTSVATEYSLKFDESMTEDEIEEKSFRSLLPSESHRRFNLEKRRGIRDDSDEETSPQKSALTSLKDLSLPFSEGQDSFSKFTMEMVRQYMKEEEMRAAHQSSLLRLRQRALKEKTKAELAWLEHQKRRLRDKGEDDKMPPIRKRQRGLLLRLQQEQAEIKRLQDASKAARKERQLILKQQEEIERIRQTTMKLQEKLKSAGEGKQDLSSEPDLRLSNPSSPVKTDQQSRSPSPVSISGSETSSIMQKLKKMRSRMDEKFLTKREQKLMQRRQHAEELLEWKHRLDAEEAEIRRIEKQALVVWDRERPKLNTSWQEPEEPRTEGKGNERESPIPSSNLHSETSVPEELGSLPPESRSHDPTEQLDHSAVTEDLASSQESKPSASKRSLPKSRSSSANLKIVSSRENTKGQLGTRPQQLSHSWSEDSLSMTQSETTSDQSDIESRIRALKDELRKRKSVVDQLRKEQKKRQKERLKAQEASLIKQLETYDEFIKRTEAELSRDLEATPSAKPQIKTPSSMTEKPKLKAPPLHRPDAVKSWKSLSESERSRGSVESINEHTVSLSPDNIQSLTLKRVTDAEETSRTPSPKSPAKDTLDSLPSSPVPADHGRAGGRSEEVSGDESVVSSQRSDIPEEVVESETEETEHLLSLKLDSALRLDLGLIRPSEPTSKEDLLPQKEPLAIPDLNTESIPRGQESIDKLVHKDKKDAAESPPQSISRLAEEHEDPPSGQVSFRKEPSYSEDFEVFSPRKVASAEETPRAETYRDDFESSSAISARNEFQSEVLPVTKSEKLQHSDSRSQSPSFVSDEDINEHYSSNSLSLSGGIHSERLLVLKPTAELQNDEDQQNKHIEVDSATTFPPPPPPPLEKDYFQSFQIGDRVLVSNVQPGTLCFMGQTHFAEGFWAGVELDKSEGNNDGAYNGTKYFDCKEKHGIFAPPHKISHFPADFDVSSEACDEGSYLEEGTDRLLAQECGYQEELRQAEEDDHQIARVKSPTEAQAGIIILTSLVESKSTQSSLKEGSMQDILEDLQSSFHDHDQSPTVSPDHTDAHITEKDLSIEILNGTFGKPSTLGSKAKAPTVEGQSNEVIEKLSTPLLDLLTKEKAHLEAQLLIPVSEERITEVGTQEGKVSSLTESLLQTYVKDTVRQLQEIQRVRDEKIHLSNRVLKREAVPQREESMPRVPPWQVQAPDSTTALQSLFLSPQLEDEREDASSPDLFPRPESPVFGTSGQEELSKRLSELELRREFLSAIRDDQDWFDEDFGISSHKVQPTQSEAPLPKVEPSIVKAHEEPILAVPHTITEVEGLVRTATEELWIRKQRGHDLQSISLPSDFMDSSTNGEDLESVSRRVYKEAVFDLTREIFGEIFADDPNLHQPVWMKPYRATSAYYRRVKNPNNLEEIKLFLTAEVLKLCSLKKEENVKTDWQKMMKFGRKKRDRVDHILVQELHEEEAQWVNYDEDELSVKMQLADGIFEALLRDTLRVLHKIQEKQIQMLLV